MQVGNAIARDSILARTSRVLEYPDLTRDASGAIAAVILEIVPILRVNHRELNWAHERLIRPLNEAISAAAIRQRWTLVSKDVRNRLPLTATPRRILGSCGPRSRD